MWKFLLAHGRKKIVREGADVSGQIFFAGGGRRLDFSKNMSISKKLAKDGVGVSKRQNGISTLRLFLVGRQFPELFQTPNMPFVRG